MPHRTGDDERLESHFIVYSCVSLFLSRTFIVTVFCRHFFIALSSSPILCRHFIVSIFSLPIPSHCFLVTNSSCPFLSPFLLPHSFPYCFLSLVTPKLFLSPFLRRRVLSTILSRQFFIAVSLSPLVVVISSLPFFIVTLFSAWLSRRFIVAITRDHSYLHRFFFVALSLAIFLFPFVGCNILISISLFPFFFAFSLYPFLPVDFSSLIPDCPFFIAISSLPFFPHLIVLILCHCFYGSSLQSPFFLFFAVDIFPSPFPHRCILVALIHHCFIIATSSLPFSFGHCILLLYRCNFFALIFHPHFVLLGTSLSACLSRCFIVAAFRLHVFLVIYLFQFIS